jgi:hypothetical protein
MDYKNGHVHIVICADTTRTVALLLDVCTIENSSHSYLFPAGLLSHLPFTTGQTRKLHWHVLAIGSHVMGKISASGDTRGPAFRI